MPMVKCRCSQMGLFFFSPSKYRLHFCVTLWEYFEKGLIFTGFFSPFFYFVTWVSALLTKPNQTTNHFLCSLASFSHSITHSGTLLLFLTNGGTFVLLPFLFFLSLCWPPLSLPSSCDFPSYFCFPLNSFHPSLNWRWKSIMKLYAVMHLFFHCNEFFSRGNAL